MEIEIRPFTINMQIIAKYVEWFNLRKQQAMLYQGTPHKREDVRAWLVSCINDRQREYFHVYKNDKLVGHIGLRGINREKKYAEVGSFLVRREDRCGKVMEASLEFLIGMAKRSGLRLLTADFTDEGQQQISLFLKAGFTRTPGAPHYLTFNLG